MKFLAFGFGGGARAPKLSMARRHWFQTLVAALADAAGDALGPVLLVLVQLLLPRNSSPTFPGTSRCRLTRALVVTSLPFLVRYEL